MDLTALFIFGDIRRRTFDELRFSSFILRRYETGSFNRSIVGLTNLKRLHRDLWLDLDRRLPGGRE